MKICLVFFFLFLTARFSATAPISLAGQASLVASTTGQLQLDERDDIWEAVVRYLLKDWRTEETKVYFLAVGENEDPSDAFMKRFAEHVPQVKKISQASISGSEVRDKETHEAGAVFTIKSLEMVNKDEASVRFDCRGTNRSVQGNVSVILEQGKWTVKTPQKIYVF